MPLSPIIRYERFFNIRPTNVQTQPKQRPLERPCDSPNSHLDRSLP